MQKEASWPKRNPSYSDKQVRQKSLFSWSLYPIVGETDKTKINYIVCETVITVKNKIKQGRGKREFV